MTKDFWNRAPQLGPPIKFEFEGQTHFIRRVSTYELSLASDQCINYCGCDIETMSGKTPHDQILASAFFATFALCDPTGQPFFDSGPGKVANPDFIKQVEVTAQHQVMLLTGICVEFISANAPQIDPELLESAKKNLNTTKTENGKSDKPLGTAQLAANG